MIFKFQKDQAAFLRETFKVDPLADMDDDAQLQLEDALGDYLQLHGINDSGNGENAIGRMCADILTVLAANE